MPRDADVVTIADGRVVRRLIDDEVFFSVDYLSDVVDKRLERAVDKVLAAARRPEPLRSMDMAFAHVDYAAAHVVASLVDDHCYDANEWPLFVTWAAELVRAARL